MPTFNLLLSDGRQIETSIEAADRDDAMNTALNALSKFACSRFPPPESISIDVSDDRKERLATMRFSFTIEYA